MRESKKRKIPSPFVIFAVVDGIAILISCMVSLYDFFLSAKYFAGFLGTLIMVYLVPALVGMLIIDMVWGLIRRKKHGINNSGDRKCDGDGVL